MRITCLKKIDRKIEFKMCREATFIYSHKLFFLILLFCPLWQLIYSTLQCWRWNDAMPPWEICFVLQQVPISEDILQDCLKSQFLAVHQCTLHWKETYSTFNCYANKHSGKQYTQWYCIQNQISCTGALEEFLVESKSSICFSYFILGKRTSSLCGLTHACLYPVFPKSQTKLLASRVVYDFSLRHAQRDIYTETIINQPLLSSSIL